MVKKTDDSCSHSYMPRTGRRTELPWLTELCTDARRILKAVPYIVTWHSCTRCRQSLRYLSFNSSVYIVYLKLAINRRHWQPVLCFLWRLRAVLGIVINFFYLNQNHKSCSKNYLQIQIQIRTCRVRLTNCPGALTKCQKAIWSRWDLRSCLNLLVSVMSLMLWGSEFQAAGSA